MKSKIRNELSFVGFGLFHLLKGAIRVFAEYNKMHGSKDA